MTIPVNPKPILNNLSGKPVIVKSTINFIKLFYAVAGTSIYLSCASSSSYKGKAYLNILAFLRMDERIEKLNQVALQGNIDAFYIIIREDVQLLKHIDELSFVDTPLHKSASAGHIPFSIEMMKLKPTFVNKPNPDGHCPIHLALINEHIEMVCQLLQHNADLVHVKGRECMTPLHYAATTNDHLALLEKILSVCPDSITNVTTRNETALHIALKHNKLEAFKFLVGWLLRKWSSWSEILKLKDVEGNTILHIAVSKNQTQAVSHILACGERFVNINEKNLAGQTALDILQEKPQEVDNSEMRAILDGAGALTASSLLTVTPSYAHYLKLPEICEKGQIFIRRQQKGMTDERRNALLVVAALLVTVTYQAVITPPGGLWQDDHFKYNTTNALRRSPDDLFQLNITGPHKAGSATAMRSTSVFPIFLYFNTIIFLSSIASLTILIPPDQFVGAILAEYSLYLCFGYFSSLMIITQASDRWFATIIICLSPFYVYIAGGALIIGTYAVALFVDWLNLYGLGYLLKKLHGRNKKNI